MHVNRTEHPADEKALIVQLRQVAEELSAKRRRGTRTPENLVSATNSNGDVCAPVIFRLRANVFEQRSIPPLTRVGG